MHFSSVFEKFFPQRSLKGTILFKTGQYLSVFVHFHVSFERPALAKALATGGARIAVTVCVIPCLFCMHADKVAADCIPLYSRILTQVAMVRLFTCFTESMDAQLALAGEVTLAGGTLEIGVRKMQAEVLLQVGAHLEATSASGAGVGAVDVL